MHIQVKTEYLNGKDLDDKATMLRATCAIPLLFPVIKNQWKRIL